MYSLRIATVNSRTKHAAVTVVLFGLMQFVGNKHVL